MSVTTETEPTPAELTTKLDVAITNAGLALADLRAVADDSDTARIMDAVQRRLVTAGLLRDPKLSAGNQVVHAGPASVAEVL